MCGRFTLRTPAKQIATLFDLGEVPELRPRYNIVEVDFIQWLPVKSLLASPLAAYPRPVAHLLG